MIIFGTLLFCGTLSFPQGTLHFWGGRGPRLWLDSKEPHRSHSNRIITEWHLSHLPTQSIRYDSSYMIAITTAPTNLLSTGCFNHFFLHFAPRATCQILFFNIIIMGKGLKRIAHSTDRTRAPAPMSFQKIDHALSQLKLELDWKREAKRSERNE